MYDAVSPLAWAVPEDSAKLHEGRPRLPAPRVESNVDEPISRPTKKRATQSSFQKDAR